MDFSDIIRDESSFRTYVCLKLEELSEARQSMDRRVRALERKDWVRTGAVAALGSLVTIALGLVKVLLK